jgi:hypothetical protein
MQLVQPPTPDTEPGFLDFNDIRQHANDAFTTLLGTLSQNSFDIQNAPGPEMGAVPPSINPLASMFATFGASMAEQMGAHGTFQHIAQQIDAMKQHQQDVQERNQLLVEQDRRQRMRDILENKTKISDVRLAQAKALNDIDLMEKEYKTRWAIENQKMKLDADEAAARNATTIKAAEISAGTKPSVQDTQDAKIQAAVTAANNGFEAITHEPTSIMKSTPSALSGLKFWNPTQERTVLTPQASKQAQDYAMAQARSTPYKEVQIAMLSRYVDTLRDPKGQINKNDPSFAAFIQQLQTIMPSKEDRDSFYAMLGL